MRYHAIQIIEHIPGCNPKCFKTDTSKYGISSEVALRTIAPCMGLAVDFDRKPALQAREIDGVAFTSKLAAEPQPPRPFSEVLPQYEFGKSQPTA